MKPAIFLDRDGVIVKDVYYKEFNEWEAPLKIDDIVFLDGAVCALQRLASSGFELFLISNQGAFAKGKVPLSSITQVAAEIERRLLDCGVKFKESFYSYSHPRGVVEDFSGVSCERKPSTYFLRIAEAKYDLDLKKSYFIGDRHTDIICGQKVGMRTIRVENPVGVEFDESVKPDYFVKNLEKVTEIILREVRI